MTPAESLASRLHAGQTDKAGRPYAEHLEAVVGILLRRWPDAPAYAVDAAWLHDAVEDCGVGPIWLRRHGVSHDAVLLVRELTRPPTQAYSWWIEQMGLSGSLWAIRIKLADLKHNCDPARAIPGDLVTTRYQPAREVLEAALREREAANVG